MMRDVRNEYRILGVKPLIKPNRRRKDKGNNNLGELDCEGEEWMEVARDRFQQELLY
jgi:hypothetical protein